jgi:hypothetical protein
VASYLESICLSAANHRTEPTTRFEEMEGFVECTTSPEICDRAGGCVTRQSWPTGFDQSTDRPNSAPKLDPLADNGGPTQTHGLQDDSPAIDVGDNNGCPATDQRGVSRPVDGDSDGTATCDIGAFELDPYPEKIYLPPDATLKLTLLS